MSVLTRLKEPDPLPPRRKSDTRNKPLAPNLTPIRALHQPLMLILIKPRPIYMLVKLNILEDIPLLLHVLEVPSQLFPARIPFFKGEVFP